MAAMLLFLNLSILLICFNVFKEAEAVEERDSAVLIQRMKRDSDEGEMTDNLRYSFAEEPTHRQQT